VAVVEQAGQEAAADVTGGTGEQNVHVPDTVLARIGMTFSPAIAVDEHIMSLAIRDVAEQTGIAAGTLRMWEQRYGFPAPERTSSGYRRYSDEAVATLRRVVELRERGLSVPAAIAQARRDDLATDRPSIFAVLAAAQQPRLLHKRTLIALSRAIEDEALAHAAAPVAFAAFQEQRFYARVQPRWQAIARLADAVSVFADFDAVGHDGAVHLVPIADGDALANEWVVVVDAPGYAACLVAFEPPDPDAPRGGPADRERRFEAIWTVDPEVTRRAAVTAARLVARADVEQGERLLAMLAQRPLAVQSVAPALTTLTNRIVSYLD
jgi:DICT domain-containing protein